MTKHGIKIANGSKANVLQLADSLPIGTPLHSIALLPSCLHFSADFDSCQPKLGDANLPGYRTISRCSVQRLSVNCHNSTGF
jgi:hypothetical protein